MNFLKPQKVIKVTIKNRRVWNWFYAIIKRKDGKIYHIVWRSKIYNRWCLRISTYNSLPFIIAIEKKYIYDETY